MTFSDFLQGAVLEFIEERWERASGGIAASLVAGVVAGFLARDLAPRQWLAFLIGGIASVLTSAAWVAGRFRRRVPKDRVGFVVAIVCDNEAHEKRIRADFIEHLQQHLRADESSTGFHLKVLSRRESAAISSPSDALANYAKLGAGFLVFGRVRQRIDENGHQAHFIDLEGLVAHSPIPKPAQAELAADFSTVLPRRLKIPDAGSVHGFEIASDWLELSARYVIGRAALMSRYLPYATQVLLSVERALQGRSTNIPAIAYIRTDVPKRLTIAYNVWAGFLCDEYQRTRDEQFLKDAEPLADEALRREPRAYSALLTKAICVFVLRREVAHAKKILRRARGPEMTWRFGLAFLKAYDGQLDDADNEYRNAFKGQPADASMYLQSEEFILTILAKEPQAGRLHYCSALINIWGKHDLLSARRDLAAFLATGDSARFPAQKDRAQRLLAQIECGEEPGTTLPRTA